jgi:hypothetical protein
VGVKYQQVRGTDLKHHAVDSEGAVLCGLPARKVIGTLGTPFKPDHPRSCPACAERSQQLPSRRRRRA